MRSLLDTHLLLWATVEPWSLSEQAADVIGDPRAELWFSAVSIWEAAVKLARNKPDFTVDPTDFRSELLELGMIELAITGAHAAAAALLPPIHKDPFDRLLVAQAALEGMTLLTADPTVARYPGPIRLI